MKESKKEREQSLTREERARRDARRKRQKKRRRMKALLITVFTLLVLLIVFFIVLFASGVGQKVIALYEDAAQLVAESTTDTFQASQTSLIYDVNGDEIMSISDEKDVQYLTIDEIPQAVKDAFVDVEDKNFYSHGGYSLKAIARAALSIVKNGEVTQGGSTITQQLARNVFLSHEVSWQRKVEEIFIASMLEKKYTKDQILEFYINNIYFANGYYGIEAAAQGYFSCSTSDLSLSQIVFLCAIPNNPTLYDPLENADNTVKRRDRMLEEMLEEGDITQAEYEAATAETIELNVKETKSDNSVSTYVFYCATRALMEQSGFEFKYEFSSDSEKEAYDEEYQDLYVSCQKKLYTEGYQIYTSIDMEMQEELQTAVDETLAEFDETDEDGIYTLQSAATCIDNETGYVVAIVGGRDQGLSSALNRAYQSFRQPGSSIKPLAVYTPAIEQLGYTPDSIVNDQYIEDGPSNSDGSYDGKISLRWAVAQSKNTIAWQIFEELTPKVGLRYLLEMQFSKIDEEDYTLSSALGGLTNGVSTVEMASGYATLANDGKYRTPTCIVKILASDGQKVLSTSQEETRIYEKNASLMMTSMLQTVMTDGTGKSVRLDSMPCAGKTGTTNDNKDGWFCGYTPYYTTAVWVGYDMPQTLTSLQGASYPGRIWNTFMEAIHEGLDYQEFEEYETASNESTAIEIDLTEEPVTETPEATETAEPTETPEATEEATPEPTEEATPEPTPEPTVEPTVEPTETPEPVVTTTEEAATSEEDLGEDNDNMDWDEIN